MSEEQKSSSTAAGFEQTRYLLEAVKPLLKMLDQAAWNAQRMGRPLWCPSSPLALQLEMTRDAIAKAEGRS